LGKLAGGVAVIKVGAPAESAQKELKQRVDDAVAATRAAMEEGIVPGGGIALYNVSYGFESEEALKNLGDKESAAQRILIYALKAPLRAIIENSGESPDKFLVKLDNEKSKVWRGFNALTNKVVDDLREVGIIDPLKVTRAAFMNAVSVAANYLTIGAAVTNIPEKKDGGMPSGGMPGMGGDY
jgi:chaperonin GroEL